MINLDQRSERDELMDDPGLDVGDYTSCLSDLARLNRLTLAHRPVLRWLAAATANLPARQAIRILDVGFGQADLLRAIWEWARRADIPVLLEGVDRNPRSVHAAHRATPRHMEIILHIADVFEFTPRHAPDFVVSSQFVHHLDNEHIVQFVRWCDAQARRGWCIADLQRSALSYYGYRWLARMTGLHPVVQHDGAVSISRSFRREDWQVLLLQAGSNAGIHHYFPFRMRIDRLK